MSPEAAERNRARAREWGRKNSRRVVERVKKWREKNPEKDRAQRVKYRQNRKDKIREANKRWRAKRPDYHANWVAANPERIELSNKVRKARRRRLEANASGTHTIIDLRAILKQQRGRCAYCRTKLIEDRHLDHIQPLSRGGSNDPKNLQFLCRPCNLKKGAMDPVDYARSVGRLV